MKGLASSVALACVLTSIAHGNLTKFIPAWQWDHGTWTCAAKDASCEHPPNRDVDLGERKESKLTKVQKAEAGEQGTMAAVTSSAKADAQRYLGEAYKGGGLIETESPASAIWRAFVAGYKASASKQGRGKAPSANSEAASMARIRASAGKGPWGNKTVIGALTYGMVNIASKLYGITSKCKIMDRYAGECSGSIDSLYGDVVEKGHPNRYFRERARHYWSEAAWFQVNFKGEFHLKFMALVNRPCPCERWSDVRLYGSQRPKTPVEVKLLSKAVYGLYPIDMTTTSVKLVPRAVGSRYRPGATEIEFYTPSTEAIKPACPWNPRLLSTSAECKGDAWNGYYVQQYFAFSNATKEELAKMNAIGRVVQTGPRSQLGFKLSKPTVGGSLYFGDCRIGLQGEGCTLAGGRGGRGPATCIVAKWTSCSGSTCKVKKLCYVVGLETKSSLTKQLATSQHQDQLRACLQARCNEQCLLG